MSVNGIGPSSCANWAPLVHWDNDKMADISQMTFSNAFPWNQSFVFWYQWWLIVYWTLWNKFQSNFNRNKTFSLIKLHLEMLFAKWCPFCLALFVLTTFCTGNLIVHLLKPESCPDANFRDHFVYAPANERWRYNVTLFLISWAHAQNDPYNFVITFNPWVCYPECVMVPNLSSLVAPEVVILRFVMMPTFSSKGVPEVFIMATFSAISDNKVSIRITLVFLVNEATQHTNKTHWCKFEIRMFFIYFCKLQIHLLHFFGNTDWDNYQNVLVPYHQSSSDLT